MKKIKFFASALSTLLLVGTFTSCHDDDNDNDSPVPSQQEATSNTKSVSANIITEEDLTAQEYANKYLSGNKSAQKDFLQKSKSMADSVANERGENGICTKYHTIKYNYTSIDENGRPIRLSAFMSWGYFSILIKSWELSQNKVILYCPYTRTLGSQCSTESNGGYEQYTFCCDNLTIMPDYEGFGTSKERLQVYLNHGLMARQNYDALVAGKEIFESKGGKFEQDYYLAIVGCSQGGANAVALQKYMENTNNASGKSLAEEHRLEYVMAAVGPYSPEQTLKTYFSWRSIAYPCALPLVIKSMMVSYPEEFQGIDESRFYTAAYNEHKAEFDDIYLQKTMTTDQINARMKELLGERFNEKMNLTSILSKEALDLNSDITQRLLKCLRKNDLTTGWTPKHKIYLYGCSTDEVVPYTNTQLFARQFHSMIDYSEFPKGMTHTLCCMEFMAKKW